MLLQSTMPNSNTQGYRCIACGGRHQRCLLKLESVRVCECVDCGLAATVPASAVRFAQYDSRPELCEAYSAREELSRQYANKLLDFITPHATGGRFLDVGCSVGVLVTVASERGYTAEGIDLDSNSIRLGKSLGRQ